MRVKSWLLAALVAGGFLLAVTAPARLSADEFFEGKTIGLWWDEQPAVDRSERIVLAGKDIPRTPGRFNGV